LNGANSEVTITPPSFSGNIRFYGGVRKSYGGAGRSWPHIVYPLLLLLLVQSRLLEQQNAKRKKK